MQEELLNIREAAKLLNISIDTLRRWDANGKLKAMRIGGKGTHRYYKKSELERILQDPFALAKTWVYFSKPFEPAEEFYCSNSSIFQARLSKLENELQKTPNLPADSSLITAVAGEIGNNSFDHNLGNWPDIVGIFFAFDVAKRIVVLADRGLGILATLKRVKPELMLHEEALRTAFTEIVTGRAPEKRGNGLKFVRKAIMQSGISLLFQSGDANIELRAHSNDLTIKRADTNFHGCLALIQF